MNMFLFQRVKARKATIDELQLVHDETYALVYGTNSLNRPKLAPHILGMLSIGIAKEVFLVTVYFAVITGFCCNAKIYKTGFNRNNCFVWPTCNSQVIPDELWNN